MRTTKERTHGCPLLCHRMWCIHKMMKHPSAISNVKYSMHLTGYAKCNGKSTTRGILLASNETDIDRYSMFAVNDILVQIERHFKSIYNANAMKKYGMASLCI